METNNQIKVFFNLRVSSRERMWDTAREAVRVCQPLLPPVKQQTSLARADSYLKKVNLGKHIIREFIRKFPLINHQSVPGSEAAELLYMWGAFPKGTDKPFVIELDNPYVLSYYNQSFLHLRLSAIKRKLRTARFVTFLSETARNHFLELFGNEFSNKSKVLPPFMEDNYKRNKRVSDGKVRFLFVGLGFRRKGGPELLKAFSALPYENALLTIVAPVGDDIKLKYANDKRITFLPPQPREVLFTQLYPTHDIFVFPSILETLGVVILEALSFGMGIITTDVYATPEMVQNERNGVLIPHPFLPRVSLNGVMAVDPVTIPRDQFTAKYQQDDIFYDVLSQQTLEAMKLAMSNVGAWQRESESLFNEKFSPSVWERRLAEITTLKEHE
jgi:glycosyltransferase involved in cell wall biosynthesis